MSDEHAPKADEQESKPLADEELDEVSGGKILNRANPNSAGDLFDEDTLRGDQNRDGVI